ncbi:uncharacterized protein LOC135085910 [Ostrinia nubilalis]|uniref:uncharacterized protein LOC135085910 n=1 Tax=Ostrinia nubilalis TaxID=29057 RepID=UPI0030823471
MVPFVVFLAGAFGAAVANVQEKYFQENRVLAKAIVEALQDSRFEEELLFDLKKENQVYLNRTMSLVIKYIVKREVDNYRSRRTDAISRRIYSSLIMKLIDIAKAPRILAQLGKLDDLTPRLLVRKLKAMEIKPVHLGVALLIQYYLRNTVNFAIRSRTIEVLATKPQDVGPQVIDMLKALAARLLPVAELLDVHLAHSSPAFKDSCPNTWLGIVNNKQLR